jgi:signal transduction histidine kinase
MQIRNKLTFQFIAIVAFLLFVSSLAIYFFSEDYREDDFYNRLSNKGTNTAKLLIAVDEVDANLLKIIEKDNPVSLPKESIAIYDYRDELLYSSDEENVLGIDKQLLDDIRLENELRYRKGDYEILGFLYADKFDRFVVIIGAVDIYGLSKLRNLRIVLLVVFSISIILVFISGWIYAGRTLRPISKVIDQVDNITITSLNLRVDQGNGKDEIATLAATFNGMLDRLEGAFKTQKNFIANASHELRTPLTAITGQLEVILMKSRTADEYEKAMISVLDDMKNLNTISNRLLLLAQASSEKGEAAFTNLRIDELVWQASSELKKRNPEYVISVSFDEALSDEKNLTILGDEQLMKTALVNLMDNGCKYSADHKVEVHLGSEGTKKLILVFTDKGIGIEPTDLKQIFEPFHRGRNASSFKGHGIGLSLVNRIIKMHGGDIKVESKINQGTTVTVLLRSI